MKKSINLNKYMKIALFLLNIDFKMDLEDWLTIILFYDEYLPEVSELEELVRLSRNNIFVKRVIFSPFVFTLRHSVL